MTHASGTLLDHQRWSSTCTKMQPPGRTTSPAFGQQCHNRYRSHTYPPAQQNLKRPRNTNTCPPNKGTAHQPTKGRAPQRHHDRSTTRQARHLASRPRQLPNTPRGEPHKERNNDMATTDGHHRLEENPPRDNNDGSHAPPHTRPKTTNTGHAPLSNHLGQGRHCRQSPRRRRPNAPGETHTSYLDKRNSGHRHCRRPRPGVGGYPLYPGLRGERPHADGMADKVGR